MPLQCIVDKCKCYTGQGVSFHKFPDNRVLFDDWCQRICGLNKQQLPKSKQKNWRVCGKHFAPESFYTSGFSNRLLKIGSKPTIFPNLIKSESENVEFLLDISENQCVVKHEPTKKNHLPSPLLKSTTVQNNFAISHPEVQNILPQVNVKIEIEDEDPLGISIKKEQLIAEQPNNVDIKKTTPIKIQSIYNLDTQNETINRLKKRLRQKDLMLHTLRSKINRQNRKIAKLTRIIDELIEKSSISDSAHEIFKDTKNFQKKIYR